MKASISSNKISLRVYVALTLLFDILSVILFFKYIYDENRCRFEGIFFFIFIACLFVGFALTCKRHRTIWSAVTVVAIPYAVYCSIAYRGAGVIITSIIFTISLGFTAVSIFTKIIPRNVDRELVTMIRIKKLIHKAHSLAGFFSIVLVCIVFISGSTTTSAAIQNSNLKRNSDISFSIEDWETADINQKKEFAQEIIDYECGKLNIRPLTLGVEKLPKTRLAYYSNYQDYIAINNAHLENGSLPELCDSIAHECFHSVQYSLIFNAENYNGNVNIDEKVAKRISTYKAEFSDYKEYNNSEDKPNYMEYFEYYRQKCESDCRAYATAESVILYNRIMLNS